MIIRMLYTQINSYKERESMLKSQENVKISTLTKKELRAYIASVGKAVNQRIVRVQNSKYSDASQFLSYINRQVVQGSNLFSQSKSGNIKYDLNTRGKTAGELRHLAKELQKSYNASSSKIRDIKKAYQKMADTLNEGQKIKLKAEDIGEIFRVYNDSHIANNSNFGSEQVIETARKYQDKLSTAEIQDVIAKTTGLSYNDIDQDFKYKYLAKQFPRLKERSIRAILNKNRNASLSTLEKLCEQKARQLDKRRFRSSEE